MWSTFKRLGRWFVGGVEPDHSESGNARGRRETLNFFTNTIRGYFWIAGWGAIAIAVTAASAPGHESGAQIVIGVLTFLLCSLLAFVIPRTMFAVTAPLRQRDEARAALHIRASSTDVREYLERCLNDSLSRVDLELVRQRHGAKNVPDLVAEMNWATALIGAAFGPLEAMKLHVPGLANTEEFLTRLRDIADRFPTLQIREDFDPAEMEQVKAFYAEKPRPPGIHIMFKASRSSDVPESPA